MAFMALIGPAFAACDHKAVYGMLLNRYIYQDTGFLGYDDPVFQGGATLYCDGGWWFDLFNSSGLSTDGTYGNLAERQYADEFDFTVARNSEIKTALGAFQYQIFASYYLIADFDRASDDLIELRGELARAFTLPENMRSIVFSPYVRAMRFVGLGVFPDQTIIRPGLQTTVPLTEKLAFKSNVGVGFDPKAGTETFRSDTGLDYKVGNGLVLFTEWQTADGVKSAGMIGFERSF